MNTPSYRTKSIMNKGGTLAIKGLPYEEGQEVEVVVSPRVRRQQLQDRYPLRGKPVRYVDPFDGVVDDDWDALK